MRLPRWISGVWTPWDAILTPTPGCEDLCIYPDLCGECGGGRYLGMPDPTACNYDSNAACDDGTCAYPDECGVCVGDESGPGAIYECGCFEIPDGDCDCEGNGIPPGDCDCNGTPQDPCQPCGGNYDDYDPCFCPEFEPGCADPSACNYDANAGFECFWLCEYPEVGACDCDGNVLDALGVCGGDCPLDFNQNGICDTEELGGGATECGWGTYWNEDSMACVLLVPPYLSDYGDFSALNPCYFNLNHRQASGRRTC